MFDMKYSTTKKRCEERISGVCSYCGGKLGPIETVDNSGNPAYWGGCKSCGVFGWGTSSKVYKIAKKLVIECNYKHYSHIQDEPGDAEEMIKYHQLCQISGACGLVADVLRINDGHNK